MAPQDSLPMGNWVREKIGHVLEEIARIADIAKDPKTPPWYRRNLRRSLFPALGNSLKILLWSHGRIADWTPELSKRPTEHGTLGLASLLGHLDIEHRLNVSESTIDPDDDEDREPSDVDEPPAPAADPWTQPVRQWVVRAAFHRLCDDRIPVNERRLLSWIAFQLGMSKYPDVVLLDAAIPRFRRSAQRG